MAKEISVKDIMKTESILPPDFDGVFRFTNNSDKEFVAKWNGKEYAFPAKSTSSMIMPEFTPLEIQQIRKKFAMNWAEAHVDELPQYQRLLSQERNADGVPFLSSFKQAGTYDINMLAPLIQMCLLPLPVSKVLVKESKEPKLEEMLSRNKKGGLNTKAVGDDDDLKKLATEGR